MAPNATVATTSATWEQLYAALPRANARVAALRSYLETKSVGLRPAFNVPQPVDGTGTAL